MVRRGLACLIVDGPGNGESIRFRGLKLRYDYEVPAGAAVDYLEGRKDVDPKRIGIMALSLGGYYAPRAPPLSRNVSKPAWPGGLNMTTMHYGRDALSWPIRQPFQFRRIISSGFWGRTLWKTC